MSKVQWSTEQEAIFSQFGSSSSNLLVNASPGSGKTTVLCELWDQSSADAVIALAFNKNIVQELEKRLLPKLASKVCTYNSLGHRLCAKQWPTIRFNPNKLYKHIQQLEHLFPENTKSQWAYSLKTLVGFMKNSCITYTDDLVRDLVDFYDLDSYEGIEKHAITVLESSNNDTTELDFGDQLLFPILYQLKFPYYEQCLDDEVQDTNSVQRDMLLALQRTNPSIQFAFVGDSHQAIYAFRGALSDSMAVISDTFQCTKMPMTISRRCAKRIVEEAQTVWPEDISYAPGCENGIVRRSNYDMREQYDLKPTERDYTSVIDNDSFTSYDMMLCRTTAPLVQFAYSLLRGNIPCHVRGRDIGKGLVSYITKSKCLYVNDFLDYMQRDIGEQLVRAIASKNSSKIQSLYDKKETLELFASNCKSVFTSNLVVAITNLFENGKGIMLSTVHKAKGLESEKCFILAPDLMPHPLARQSWAREQEKNIQYVAITRSKRELVYV